MVEGVEVKQLQLMKVKLKFLEKVMVKEMVKEYNMNQQKKKIIKNLKKVNIKK